MPIKYSIATKIFDLARTHRSFLLTLLLLPVTVYAAPPQWEFSEDVAYKDNHDPSLIFLEDGREVQVNYTDIKWEEVDKWSAGKKLVLGYAGDKGAVLYDPVLSKFIPIVNGLEKHPIDVLLDKCMEKDDSTFGMVECYGAASTRWDKELNRSYASLTKELSAKGKELFKESQRAWMKFREAQNAANGALRENGGTIWSIIIAQQAMNLVKDQVQRLNSLQTF